MPISYAYVEEEDLLVTVWDGAVTFDECAAAALAHADDEGWRRGRLRITDTTTADPAAFVAADFGEIIKIHAANDAERWDRKLAIIAPHAKEIARTAERQIRRLGVDVFVCDSLYSACVWLGVENNTARRTIESLRGNTARRASTASA